MKTFDIKGTLRKDLGKKGSAKLRKNDEVPCVLYGGSENINFYAPTTAFRLLVYTPDVHIVNLDIEGKKCQAIIKDMQFHPVTEKLLHMDLLQIVDGKPITLNIPLKVSGNSIGIKKGGKLNVSKRTLKIKALAQHMPQEVVVDITDLDVAQTIKVGALSAENYQFMNNARETVVSILSSRLTQKAGDEAAAAAAPAKK